MSEKGDMPKKQIRIKFPASISDIGELSRICDALNTVDEIYRLLEAPNSILESKKIDFRKKNLKDVEGAKLEGFHVNSPPELIIDANFFWLGALYVLKNYSTIKTNIKEISTDSGLLYSGLKGVTDNEIKKINYGIRLLLENILTLSDDEIKNWHTKIASAKKKLMYLSDELEISIKENEE